MAFVFFSSREKLTTGTGHKFEERTAEERGRGKEKGKTIGLGAVSLCLPFRISFLSLSPSSTHRREHCVVLSLRTRLVFLLYLILCPARSSVARVPVAFTDVSVSCAHEGVVVHLFKVVGRIHRRRGVGGCCFERRSCLTGVVHSALVVFCASHITLDLCDARCSTLSYRYPALLVVRCTRVRLDTNEGFLRF